MADLSPAKRRLFFFILDHLFSMVFVGPLVIAYWRGTWGLLDVYLYPNNEVLRRWICVGAGHSGLFILSVMQEVFGTKCTKKNRVAWIIASRAYISLSAFLSVCQYNGTWGILDHYTGLGIHSCLYSMIIGQMVLWCFRCSKGVTGSPALISLDTSRDVFKVPSRFKTTPKNMENYVFDHLFSTFVLGTASIFVWRGLWALFDLMLFPEDLSKSTWYSFPIGYAIIGACVPLQLVTHSIYKKLIRRGSVFILRVLLEELVALVGGFGTIIVWRAVWLTIDIYLIPSDFTLSCWISLIISMVLLMLTLSYSSTMSAGCLLSGESRPEEGCFLGVEYFQHFFPEAAGKKTRDLQEKQPEVVQNGTIPNVAISPEDSNVEPWETLVNGKESVI